MNTPSGAIGPSMFDPKAPSPLGSSHAVIELPRPTASLGRPQPAPDNPRAAALAEFDRRLDNLRSCVHWLVDNGIAVVDSTLCRSGGIVTVAASPYLYRLLPDSAWRERKQEGALTVFTWFSVRFGTRIQWRDVTCG